MKKGFEASVILLLAVVFVIISVAIFWTAIRSTGESPELEYTEAKLCQTDDNCKTSQNGLICIQDINENFEAFCGCIINDNCITGVCGADNKCS